MATTSTAAGSSSSSARLCVCYPCALRMSTIPLPAVCGQAAAAKFHKVVLTAPPTPAEIERLNPAASSPTPFTVVPGHHPVFDIIYEHNAFYQDKVAEESSAAKVAAKASPITPIGADGKHADMQCTQQVDLPRALAKVLGAVAYDHPTCVACRGLYQYLDGYYMPRAAEEVRRSPYLDSEEISVNIGVPRGFAFIWLAAAAEYLRGAVAVHILQREAAEKDGSSTLVSSTAPAVPSVAQRLPAFPEDYSNFKDMFTPDVRARMMSRLGKAEEAEGEESTGAQKRPREDGAEEGGAASPSYRPRCAQSFKYSLSGANGVIVELSVQNDLADALTGESGGDGMATGAYGQVVHLTKAQQHEGRRDRTAAVLPKEWCTAKGAASGEPLQLFIMDDYVLPYLQDEDAGGFKGRPITVPADLGLKPIGAAAVSTTDAAPRVPSAHLTAPAAAGKWLCLQERADWDIRVAAPSTFMAPAEAPLSVMSIAALSPIACTVRHASVFIIGKYCKYMRGMSQSPWFCDATRIGTFPLSLQEYVANPILPLFFPYGIPQPVPPPGTPAAKAAAAAAIFENQIKAKYAAGNAIVTAAPAADAAEATAADATADSGNTAATITAGITQKGSLGSAVHTVDPNLIAMFHVLGYGNYKFHTAGREDVDVRMLGTGRPFVLEILNPQREKIDFAEAQRVVAEYYGGAELVTVEDLDYTTAEITVIMSKHSSEKQKVYRAVVYSSRAIKSDDDPLLVAANNVKDLVAQQSTPIRVLHRRSLLVRPKTIHSLKLTRINDHWLIADLETQAGTYIKEFVHGDMGRTVPNLGTLLQSRTDIIQLDVLAMSSMSGVGGDANDADENDNAAE